MQYSACNIVEWCICSLGMFYQIKSVLTLSSVSNSIEKLIYNKKEYQT